MNRKVIKKIMLFLLAFMLVFPVYSFGKAEAVQAAALKAPKLSKVVRVNKSVKITWKKSKGASGYYVMRKTENSSWKKIKTVKGGSKTSYTDKKVKSGTTYYYTVKAYKGKKVSSYNKKGLKIVYKVPTTTKPDTAGGIPRQQVPLLQIQLPNIPLKRIWYFLVPVPVTMRSWLPAQRPLQ